MLYGFFAISRKHLTARRSPFELQTYGIFGDLLHWFSTYLGHRSQKVMNKDHLSSQFDIFFRCTSEFCFIYINDNAENILTMCILFADDSSLQQSSYNVLDIEQKLNKA